MSAPTLSVTAQRHKRRNATALARAADLIPKLTMLVALACAICVAAAVIIGVWGSVAVGLGSLL